MPYDDGHAEPDRVVGTQPLIDAGCEHRCGRNLDGIFVYPDVVFASGLGDLDTRDAAVGTLPPGEDLLALHLAESEQAPAILLIAGSAAATRGT